MEIDELYQFADRSGIDVDWMPMRRASSLSVMLPDGSTAIAIDLMSVGSTANHKCGLGHEQRISCARQYGYTSTGIWTYKKRPPSTRDSGVKDYG